MIKASVAFSDFNETPYLRDGKIVFGQSHITPYLHRCLETVVVVTEELWFATIRERVARPAPGPSSQLIFLDEERFRLAHRDALLWPADYLMVEVARTGARIKLRAGVFGTAPVYCRTTDTAMTISYDLADFLARPCLLNAGILSRRLGMHADYSAEQIFSGVLLLTERSVLFARPGEVRYQYPQAIDTALPSQLPQTSEDFEAFASWLDQAIQMRPISPRRTAIELSGGMDSAAVACALGKREERMTSLGILLDGNDGQQNNRRKAIVDALNLSDHAVAMSDFPPPLDLHPIAGRIEYPLADFYLEAFESLWDAARARGCDTLFTGIGGDQLFPIYRDEYVPSNPIGDAIVASAQHRAAGLLTPAALEASRVLPALCAPAGPLQASVLASNACQSPHLLSRGLWPINPLGDPNLAANCKRLTFASRHERNMMRGYLCKKLGSKLFAAGYNKETFAPVLPSLIAKQAPKIRQQLTECALADMGLVNRDAVLTLLEDMARTLERSLTAPLASFLWMERFVRQFA